jgi:hypothetical protein
MPATALASQPPPETLPQPDKRVRIPPKLAKAVRLLVTGECKTQKAAAERVGMNASYLCDQLSKPKIRVFIAQELRKTIANGTIRAAARLVELVDAESEHVSAQVSTQLLQNEGVIKSDQRAIAVNVGIQAGFVLDLRDDTASLTTGQRTIEAKPLIDNDTHSPSSQADGE